MLFVIIKSKNAEKNGAEALAKPYNIVVLIWFQKGVSRNSLIM